MTWQFKILLASTTIALIFAVGFAAGTAYERSNQTRTELIAEKAANKASEAAAKAISEIEIKQTTINNKVREIIKTETIYSDCKHSPDMFQLIKDKF